MLQFSFAGLNLIIFFLTVVAQDKAPNVYCNKQTLTWEGAKESCLKADGIFIAYKTGLGIDVANLNLKNETDIWTADYAWESTDLNNSEKMCGFCEVDHGKCSSEVMFGDCDEPRYFVCRNSSTKGLDIFRGGRNVSCPNIHVSSPELQKLSPGFYWTSNIVNVIAGTGPSLRVSAHQPVFCGAYKKSIGKYFVYCETKRVSLCNLNPATSNYRNLFDKSCFENWLHSSSPKTESQTTQSTHVVLNTMAHTTVMKTKTSLKIVATPIETTATTTAGAMPHVTKSIHPGTVASRDDGRSDKQSEKYSNVGLTVGLPVGLGIALICGIILSIYFIRRYKRKPDKRSPKSKVFWNSAYSTKEDSSRFNKNSKSSSVPIVDKGNGKSEKIHGDSLKNKDSEYAVVNKNNRCFMEQDRKEISLSKEKHGNSNKPGLDKTCSDYYAKVGKTEYANQFAQSDAMHKSAYSFAKETADDNGDNKGKTATVIEDEYDVTNCTHNNISSSNIYNTLQSGDYGLFSHVRTDETDYNVLSSPQSLASDTVYDSTKQTDHSSTVDDTYNHMTEPETYGSTSINSDRKQQHKNDTDQTYDKLY